MNTLVGVMEAPGKLLLIKELHGGRGGSLTSYPPLSLLNFLSPYSGLQLVNGWTPIVERRADGVSSP